MNYYGAHLNALISEFARLPGIGAKSAQRLAFFIISQPEANVASFAEAITAAKKNACYCSVCCNITDKDPCEICANPKRAADLILVVQDPRDMAAYERIGEFDGRYHVLHGAISPLAGIGPNDLKINELMLRIEKDRPNELILATNANVEGEATALYINNLLKPIFPDLLITRIARGVPMGADIEYVDQATLARALSGRRALE